MMDSLESMEETEPATSPFFSKRFVATWVICEMQGGSWNFSEVMDQWWIKMVKWLVIQLAD